MAPSDYPPEVLERLRALPAVDELAERLPAARPHALRVEAARAVLAAARDRIAQGAPANPASELVEDAEAWIASGERRLMQPVINATGVLIHTNIGRVPLGRRQLDKVEEIASGYTNLEYDLAEGKRGDRYGHASELVARVTGAEDALIVNNNAAAVLLVLSSLCHEREMIISRGELIEIGGEFRIPDVMTASGAHLVEVGTTNRTHLADYERAISGDTAAVMKVHTSNYKVVGFAKSVDRRDVGKLARGRCVLFIEDLGSGLLADDALPDHRDEPTVRRSIESGADVVTFSGDKLLGGPQAGVIAGRTELIERVRKNPLLRAVRVDKMTLAALEATLDAYVDGTWRELPFWAMALADTNDLEARARRAAVRIADEPGVVAKIEAIRSTAVPGGGSLPGEELASWALSVVHPERSAAVLHAELRSQTPPVIGRIEDDRLLLDLRTVAPEDDETVAAALLTIVR